MGKIEKFLKAIGRGLMAGASWLDRKLADFQILILSAVILIAYLLLLCIGVAIQNRLLIIIPGIVASMCFSAIVFLALERPSLFHGLVSRLGFTLTGGKWSAEDKKRARCLWFLAVAPLFFTFWLAMFPTRMMGLLAIIAALCLLTLLIIGHWQEIPSNFWKAYYHFAKKAFPVTIILALLIYAPFAGFWNSVGRFVVQKSQQAAAWMSSSSKAEKRAEKPKSWAQKKAVVVTLRPAAKRADAPAMSRLSGAKAAGSLLGHSQKCAVSDDDDLAEAAEAGLTAFDQMRKELTELHAPKSPRKNRSASSIKTPWWAE